MPGTIIRALRDAESKNPLFMIDEIDKMGADYRGDPASAMLEVLDPEQNATFRDHYLDVPFDLSDVMFITTGNTLDTIPGPLRDRMELIQLAGYTEEEKLEIAKRYLVPRQIERNGLKKSWISFTDAALRAVIRDYTREAGVRGLEREIGTLCRKVARQVAESSSNGSPGRTSISEPRVRELLGRPRFFSESKRRTRQPGVATGLAWTPVGGDVLFIEATAYPGEGKLTITGQLGDVMRESAQAALSYVRSHLAAAGAGARRGVVRRARHPHPRARGRDAEGRAQRRHHDGHRARVAAHRASRARRRRHDRRDHPHRPGAADRRAEGEGARRSAQRRAHRHRARRSTSATSRTSPSTCATTSSSSSSRRSARCSRWRSRRRPRPTAASARVQPHRAGYRIGTGQQATSGDRGMAAKKQAAKARSAATGASPYVQRVIEDAELRENVRIAVENARKAYGRLTNGKPATKVLDDKKLHKEVKQAAESLRDAGQALREGPKKKKQAPWRVRQAAVRRHHRRRRGHRR